MILRDDSAAKDAVQRLVREVNAKKVDENFRSPAEGIVHDVTWEIIPGVELYYAEDAKSGSSGVVILGDQESQVAKYGSLVKQYLHPLEQEEILAMPGAAPNENMRARSILQVGFGAPYDFDERFYSVIQDAMSDESIWVRTAAVQATQYSFWPQYRDCLRHRAIEEPDPLLREEAAYLAEAPVQSIDENQGGDEP
jgi:hypothetical protein